MKMPRNFTAIPATVLMIFCTSAMADTSLPVQQEGKITYITGGIGENEEKDLHSQRSEYQLHVINEGAKGSFVGGEHITIRDRKGNELLSVNGGPLFYANLPPGKYTVEADVKDRAQSKPVTIASNKPENVRFIW